MNSTFIPAADLKDLSTVELQSKFFQMSADVERLRQKCGKLPMAEASLQNVAPSWPCAACAGRSRKLSGTSRAASSSPLLFPANDGGPQKAKNYSRNALDDRYSGSSQYPVYVAPNASCRSYSAASLTFSFQKPVHMVHGVFVMTAISAWVICEYSGLPWQSDTSCQSESLRWDHYGRQGRQGPSPPG